MTAAPPIGGPALHALLAGAIDYAGLYPPAQLDLASAVANYLAYRESADRWALGRFVVPAGRLEEFATALGPGGGTPPPIPLSVTIGARVGEDVRLIEAFERRDSGSTARIDSVEVKAGSARNVSEVLGDIPFRWKRYVEVPAGAGSDAVLRWVSLAGVFAKVRTGGTDREAFPSPDALLQFLEDVCRRRVPFKATAGLHHPLRGSYRLTYAPDSACAPMYGYLNLALAAAILWRHGTAARARAEAALVESAPGALRSEGTAWCWREERFELDFLAAFRRDFFHGFGSCSFREPLDELGGLASQ